MIFGFFNKLYTVLSTVHGWVIGVALIAINYFARHETSIFAVLVATILDLIWGIAAALRQKRFALSELARNTISKLAVYGTALAIFVAFERMIDVDNSLSLPIVASVIVLVETWSFAANALIVYPDFPLLSLLKKVLTGEIANKLHIEEREVDKYLKRRQRKRNSRGRYIKEKI